MIKSVVFDIGGVVWDYRPFFKALLGRWGRLMNKGGQEMKARFDLVYQKFELDRLRVDQWLSELGGSGLLEETRRVFTDVSKEYFEAGLDEEILGLIGKLKRRGLAVGCLSNTENFMMPIQEMINGKTRFDFRVLSWQVGARKPMPEIYRRIFYYGDWQPNEVVFIDDKKENVVGAQKVGIKGVLFSGVGKLISKLLTLGICF